MGETVELIDRPAAALNERPDPAAVRGVCPCCSAEIVSNCYYVDGKGYYIAWECRRSLGKAPTCDYRRVL